MPCVQLSDTVSRIDCEPREGDSGTRCIRKVKECNDGGSLMELSVDSKETHALGKTGRRREQLLRQDGAPPLVLLLNRLVVKALPANQRVRYSLP